MELRFPKDVVLKKDSKDFIKNIGIGLYPKSTTYIVVFDLFCSGVWKPYNIEVNNIKYPHLEGFTVVAGASGVERSHLANIVSFNMDIKYDLVKKLWVVSISIGKRKIVKESKNIISAITEIVSKLSKQGGN